jgi:secreted trypsin-like serine protease
MSPNPRLNLPRRRLLIALLAVCICTLASILAMSSQALASSGSNPFEGSGQLVPQIINGKESSISEFPWQVFVLVNEGPGKYGSCGGSILNATTILTAAHCVTEEGTTTKYPDSQVDVIAGANLVSVQKLLDLEEGQSISEEEVISPRGSTGAQIKAGVTTVRVDPNYAAQTSTNPIPKDDVAVLTLSTPLELSAARNTAAISLVATGATPAAGTTLSISGYGREEGSESAKPNGKFYSTTLTAMSSNACEEYALGNTAIYLCAESPTSATCQGDSGGPLTEGSSPAVQVGIVDSGLDGCPTGKPSLFTNVAAPEIRDFIEGSESPPTAPRPSSLPAIKSVGVTPVDFSPLTCEPGAWNGSPSYTYTFQSANAAAQVLQSGTSNVFVPPASLVGTALVCIVQASNSGGVSTLHSSATAAIAADTAAPTSSIAAVKCVKQACTLSISASDPNGVALTAVTSSASYLVTAKCPATKKKKKSKKGKKVKQPVCHKTTTVPMALVNSSAGVYTASVSGLPYSEAITFDVAASNAAGLKQAAPAVAVTTLHKPKPKPKRKKSKKKRK